jgi:hypothetical protein
LETLLVSCLLFIMLKVVDVIKSRRPLIFIITNSFFLSSFCRDFKVQLLLTERKVFNFFDDVGKFAVFVMHLNNEFSSSSLQLSKEKESKKIIISLINFIVYVAPGYYTNINFSFLLFLTNTKPRKK